jgi:hypothetical protein
MECVLRYRGKDVTVAEVQFIRELIAAHSTLSRRQLSTQLCQAWNWVQLNGQWRTMVCRGLMLALHRAGHIELPPVRHVPCNPVWSKRSCGLAVVEFQQASQPLARLDLASRFADPVFRHRKNNHIPFALVISFTVKMKNVIG